MISPSRQTEHYNNLNTARWISLRSQKLTFNQKTTTDVSVHASPKFCFISFCHINFKKANNV